MKTSAILRCLVLGAIAATTARAWDFSDASGAADAASNVTAASQSGESSGNTVQHIVGGSVADASKYKYIVSLRDTSGSMTTFCGGTLIAPQYVLTAAHCVDTSKPLVAAIGASVVSGVFDGERIPVTQAYVHPKHNKATKTNDVAVLKLKSKSSVTPAKLARSDGSDNKEGSFAVVRGWGTTEGGGQSWVMLEVNLRIISNAACAKQFAPSVITSDMLCAGDSVGQGACKGDSGGPLMANNRVIGVVSFGSTNCGSTTTVFSRVASSLEFINKVINSTSTLSGKSLKSAVEVESGKHAHVRVHVSVHADHVAENGGETAAVQP